MAGNKQMTRLLAHVVWRSGRACAVCDVARWKNIRPSASSLATLRGWPPCLYPLYLLSPPTRCNTSCGDNARNYRKGVLFKSIAALQGQGLLTSEGEHWLRQRRVVQPAFHRRQLATFAEVMGDEAHAVVREWRQAGQTGLPVNVAERMNRLTFNVVARAVLGVAPDTLEEYSRQLKAIALRLLQYMQDRAAHPWALPAWIPTPGIGSFAVRWRSTTPWCSRSSCRPSARSAERARACRRICSRCCWQRATTRQAQA